MERALNEQSSAKMRQLQENLTRSQLTVEEGKRKLETKTTAFLNEKMELQKEVDKLRNIIDEYDKNANGVISENYFLKEEMGEVKAEFKQNCDELAILKE